MKKCITQYYLLKKPNITKLYIFGFPSDYGWSNREQDKKYASKEILMEFLHNTLALEVDRGHWSLDEVEGVQIHKVIEKTITTTEDTLENYGAGIKEIKKLGKKRYGWKE